MQGLMERLERAIGRLELLSAGSHRPPGDCGEVNGVNGGRTTQLSLLVSLWSLNFVPTIGFSWNISVNFSFLCHHDINQMQVIPQKEKKKVSIHSPQKLPLSVPVNSTVRELNVIVLSSQCLRCSSTFSD